MKMIRSSLALHQAFHRQSLNRMAHSVAVPLMIFGAMIPLSWMGAVTAGAPITLAMILTATLSLVYLQCDMRLGAALTLILMPMLYAAHLISELPVIEGALISAVCLAAGIAMERLAHTRIEGRNPPMLETMQEFVLGPLWLGMEAMAAMGVGGSSSDAGMAASKSVAR